MQQLWIDHNRIDSIGQLRSRLSDAAPQQRDAMCAQLLEHLTAGILTRWLERQPECYSITDAATKKVLLTLKQPIPENIPTSAHYKALGELCGLPSEQFIKKQTFLEKDNAKKAEKLELLRKQSWWAANAETFERSVKDWSLVVLSDSELQIALSRLRTDSAVMRTVYLCPVKSPSFTLNLRNVRKATIIGINRPIVRHSSLPAGQTINAQAQQLVLQDFTLQCRGHEAVTNCGDCKQFSQTVI